MSRSFFFFPSHTAKNTSLFPTFSALWFENLCYHLCPPPTLKSYNLLTTAPLKAFLYVASGKGDPQNYFAGVCCSVLLLRTLALLFLPARSQDSGLIMKPCLSLGKGCVCEVGFHAHFLRIGLRVAF